MSLLSALGAAQQLQRSAASLAPRQLALGPWRGDGDAAPSSGEARLGGWGGAVAVCLRLQPAAVALGAVWPAMPPPVFNPLLHPLVHFQIETKSATFLPTCPPFPCRRVRVSNPGGSPLCPGRRADCGSVPPGRCLWPGPAQGKSRVHACARFGFSSSACPHCMLSLNKLARLPPGTARWLVAQPRLTIPPTAGPGRVQGQASLWHARRGISPAAAVPSGVGMRRADKLSSAHGS